MLGHRRQWRAEAAEVAAVAAQDALLLALAQQHHQGVGGAVLDEVCLAANVAGLGIAGAGCRCCSATDLLLLLLLLLLSLSLSLLLSLLLSLSLLLLRRRLL